MGNFCFDVYAIAVYPICSLVQKSFEIHNSQDEVILILDDRFYY